MLAPHFKKTAIVEADVFFSFLNFSKVNKEREKQIVEWAPLCWENAVCTIKNLTKAGFTVIVPYPLYKDDYNRLLRVYKNTKEDIYLITLKPNLDLVWGKFSKRKDKRWERKFAQWQTNIGISSYSAGITINNSDLTPLQTKRRILQAIRNEKARVH